MFPTNYQSPTAELTEAIRNLTLESARARESLDKNSQASRDLAGAYKTPAQPGGAGGGGGLGAGGLGGRGVGAGLAAFDGVKGILEKATQLGNIARNSSMTGAQAAEEFARNIPVIGGMVGALQGFRDALANTEDRIRQANRAYERQNAALDRYADLTAIENRSASEQSTAIGRYNQVGRTAIDRQEFGAGHRTTLEGAQQFAAEQRMLPHKDAVRAAQDEANAARESLKNARERFNKNDSTSRESGHKLEMAQRRLDSKLFDENGGGQGVDKAGKVEAGRDLQAAAKQARIDEINLARSAEEVQARKVDLAQKENALARERVGSAREELSLIQAQGDRLRANSGRLGGMNRAQRQQGLLAARLVKERGLENVPDNVRDAAERFAPDFIRKAKEEYGEQTPEGKAARREGFFGIDKGTIAENDRKEDQARADVRVQVVLDEQALAAKIVEALKQGFGDVIASVKRQQAADKEERRGGQQVQYATQNR